MSLTAAEIVIACSAGVFPMAEDRNGPLVWLSPDPRSILPLEQFHVPRRLAQTLRSGRFRFTTDLAFETVIDGCARPDTWISPEIRAAYVDLHRRGIAHSVEAWQGDALAGGLYGVHLGAAFMAESMFHAARDASKAALVALVRHLRRIGVTLCDTQFLTPHLAQFGALEIPRADYLARLRPALELPAPWGPPGPLTATNGSQERPPAPQ
ncbi:MAG: leucyl/phenylalanyl-tRNA--protein transferase [Candidatus Brocadiae bacterium]|nr:leucyl/phenylalanyl-tRNA--protein transferase [Candidatus Brocadiia bacterium]